MTEQSTTVAATEGRLSTSSPGSDLRPAQRARYMRIIASARELAAEGGYDAVQMRAVADRSGVALGTVYRYFPSKNHLLVVALVLEFEAATERFTGGDIPGDGSAERIMNVLRAAVSRLAERPLLYDALVRAAMFADATSAPELDRLGQVLTELFAKAADIEVVTEEVLNAVRIVADVWMSSLVSWAAGRQSAEAMLDHMDTTVTLVFDRLERLQRAS
ncbi:TetR family transcriptional regulator [Rhodococcus sp. Z13]|uniref:TetR family transcriptional regulator n=1 Tax=Rhodococcus sacchari TaxID=2962047 RepID=A0ACD4DHX9_9NOCA|nr:TetR family transcriptional regulator [Rhodococcus sp. Z13]UYP19641.1 TetR family transcriptional regulator [Rhodococcus sp. Z13]